MVEVPDSTTRYIQSDSGKPTKDLFNWMRNISQQLADILSGTGGGMFSSGLPCFSVNKGGTDQATVPSGVLTSLTWSTEVYDVGNYFASDVWTPPAGKVAISCTIVATPNGASFTPANFQSLVCTKNGSAFRASSVFFQVNTNGFGFTLYFEDVATGTDAYGMSVLFQVNGALTTTISGSTINSFFVGHWISP